MLSIALNCLYLNVTTIYTLRRTTVLVLPWTFTLFAFLQGDALNDQKVNARMHRILHYQLKSSRHKATLHVRISDAAPRMIFWAANHTVEGSAIGKKLPTIKAGLKVCQCCVIYNGWGWLTFHTCHVSQWKKSNNVFRDLWSLGLGFWERNLSI